MSEDMNRNDENEQEPLNIPGKEEPAAAPTPEEEAAKAIEEARMTEVERLEAERRQQEAEWEANFRRAEEERRREQEEQAEAIRREYEAKEAAEKAAKAEKKARKKKGLRLTAVVLAVALLVGAAGYGAGEISKTIKGLKDQVSSLEDANNRDRLVDGTVPEASADEFPGRNGKDRESRPERPDRETTEAAAVEQTSDSRETVSADPVIGTAASVESRITGLTDVSDIVEKVLPSVVSIVITQTVSYPSYWGGNREYEEKGAGSGIIIGDDGNELWIVTNHHVIEDSDTIEITFCDEKSVSAYLKGSDKDNDLAVVGVKLADLEKSTRDSIRVITVGESDSLKLGQGVIAIGNALGWGQSVTTGVVSALNREVEFEDGTKMYLLQTSAAINPGNSGGALLNSKGELIGINNSKYSDTDVEGIGFAIPISSVKEIMNKLSLMQPRTPVAEADYPYLGVTFKNLSSGYMDAYGIPNGAYIYEVAEGTPAAKAGLLAYDIITGINDVKISSYDDLVNELQYYKGGTEVELTVMRLNRGQYSEVKVTVTLGLRSEYQR